MAPQLARADQGVQQSKKGVVKGFPLSEGDGYAACDEAPSVLVCGGQELQAGGGGHGRFSSSSATRTRSMTRRNQMSSSGPAGVWSSAATARVRHSWTDEVDDFGREGSAVGSMALAAKRIWAAKADQGEKMSASLRASAAATAA